MPILGSHMSIAGGYFKAVVSAEKAGCDCVQLFTKNNNQWRAKPITEEDASKFKEKLAELNITHPLSHASYLINLASPNEELRLKSLEAMIVEIERADLLGIPFVVFHPGSFTTSDESTGLKAIIQSLDEIHKRTEGLSSFPLLENTAGQGSNLGWDFGHLQTIIEGVQDSDRLGVCIDTCHAFAAGYGLGTREQYKMTMDEAEETFGANKIKAFHLNDSKKPFGSRKDRHEHIGLGEMGLAPFRNLLNDSRFTDVPMYLETAKGENDDGEDWDQINLAALRDLVKAV